MALAIYSFLLLIVLLLGSPYYLLAMATSGKYREGLSERLGFVPKRLRDGDPRRTIWVHAVSVGEVLAASRLVNELGVRAPQYRVLLSTTTRTGQRLGPGAHRDQPRFLFPARFPLDRKGLSQKIGSRIGDPGGDRVLAQPADRVPAVVDPGCGGERTGV